MRTRRAAILGLLVVSLVAGCGRDDSGAVKPALASPPAPAPVAPPPPKPVEAAKPAPRTETPAPNPVLSELWYRMLQDGQPSGWLHVKWTRSTFEGKPAVHDRTERYSVSTRQMGNEADTFESKSVSDVDRTEDGLLLRLETHGAQGDRLSDSTQIWNGKGYEFTSHVAGLEEKHQVASEALCPVDTEAFLSTRVQRGEVSVGQAFEYRTPNFLGKRLDTVKVRVEAREKLTLATGEFDCLRVVESVVGVPGETRSWLDPTGVLRRLRYGTTEIVSSTEEKARDLSDGGAVYSITMDADPVMPRCTSLDRAVLEVTFAEREGLELPDIPETPFGRELSRDGNTILVELTAHDAAPDPVALPVTDPAFARHLERTNLFCWDAPRVKAALAKAVGQEKDPEKIVKRILAFVFVTLRKASGPIPEPTAVEILEDGGGDCSEHCVLFVTLCRGAGIPTRRLSGYAQVGDMWGSHSFAEVWLGRWIGCDPTTNEFGTKARYLCWGWEDDPDSFPDLQSSRARGRMTMRTVEFAEGESAWKTEALADDKSRDRVLSGFEFGPLPKDWFANVLTTAQAKVGGPGVRADLTVMWGYGDLGCDLLSGRFMQGGKRVQFAGHEALRQDTTVRGHTNVQLMIPVKRRLLSLRIRIDDSSQLESGLATLATVLKPSLD